MPDLNIFVISKEKDFLGIKEEILFNSNIYYCLSFLVKANKFGPVSNK